MQRFHCPTPCVARNRQLRQLVSKTPKTHLLGLPWRKLEIISPLTNSLWDPNFHQDWPLGFPAVVQPNSQLTCLITIRCFAMKDMENIGKTRELQALLPGAAQRSKTRTYWPGSVGMRNALPLDHCCRPLESIGSWDRYWKTHTNREISGEWCCHGMMICHGTDLASWHPKPLAKQAVESLMLAPGNRADPKGAPRESAWSYQRSKKIWRFTILRHRCNTMI